jgi:hypothetical protein
MKLPALIPTLQDARLPNNMRSDKALIITSNSVVMVDRDQL